MPDKYSDEDRKRLQKRLSRLLDEIKSSVVFVEGKKDRDALRSLGCTRIMTVSGNLKSSCRNAHEKHVRNVVILTDMDRRGEELAEEARKELERYGINGNVEIRRTISKILNIREFEAVNKKYEEFKKNI